MNNRLTHLSLFSGIGGLDLAAEWAGFHTVGQCEWADYPTKILEKHWPDVPRWRDIRTLTKENFYERTGLRTVDVISGGFPCQPFSTAGKRRGKEDDRYLWPEMLRVIEEIRPTWIVGENVAGIINMALDQVLSDLEEQGYETRAVVFPACGVDATHRRDRVCIVGWSGRQTGLLRADTQDAKHTDLRKSETATQEQPKPYRLRSDVADAQSDRLQGVRSSREQERGTRLEKGESKRRCHVHDAEGWTVEPGMGRSFDGLSVWMDGVRSRWANGTWEEGIPRIVSGVPNRVGRLKAIGNAVVPQQFYPVFRAIADIENGGTGDVSAVVSGGTRGAGFAPRIFEQQEKQEGVLAQRNGEPDDQGQHPNQQNSECND